MIDKLHIVCLAQPYPPIYGGAVEMYYKLKALHKAGIRLAVHVFLYGGAKPQPELEKLASKVIYYERRTSIKSQLSLLPYIVKSRADEQLLENLCHDDSPILFEGLHTCAFLAHPLLAGRMKMVRMHNIEHDFYRQLASYRFFSWKSVFYRLEAWKLKHYEKVLTHADRILAISDADAEQLSKRFPENDVRLLNCFFDDTRDDEGSFTKPYLLYHGNLSISENIYAVKFLLSEIAPRVKHKLIIAGLNPAKTLCQMAAPLSNVEVIANPDQLMLDRLVREAHVNLLITFQPTGIKLKLLHALYKGSGYCVANDAMLHGNNLESLCVKVNSGNTMIETLNTLMEGEISPNELKIRREKIRQLGYNNVRNIIDL